MTSNPTPSAIPSPDRGDDREDRGGQVSSCKWAGREQPRVIPARHNDDCRSETCGGCLACTESHCRVCGITHADGSCPECLASTRADLRTIGILCDSLPEEVEHRGIHGEAMVLLGPVADPEARGHLEASVLAGRVSADYLDVADGEQHPLFVLGSWLMMWQDALEHEDDSVVTIESAIGYLDRQLTYMAGFDHVPFEDFAAATRQCRAHLESVLHAGEQVDTGVPCLDCGVRLVREWGKLAMADGWRCPKCKKFSNEEQYRLAVKGEHLAQAEWLTASDCSEWLTEMADADDTIIAATPGTIRAWATKGKVRKRRDSGRTMYRKSDALERATSATNEVA